MAQTKPETADGQAAAAQKMIADLTQDRDALEAENARLLERLAAAGELLERAGSKEPAKATEPSFKFSEGQRDELERTGRTVSPFTGKRYVGSSASDAREAESAEEFAKAKPAGK